MNRFAKICGFFCIILSCTSSIVYADDAVDHTVFKKQVLKLHEQQNFKSLNNIYLNALNKQSKNSSGTMLLWDYYRVFETSYETLYADENQQWKEAEKRLKQWQKLYPQSAAPKIILIRLMQTKSNAYSHGSFKNPDKASCNDILSLLDKIQVKLFSTLQESSTSDKAEFIGDMCHFAYDHLIKGSISQIDNRVINDPEWFITKIRQATKEGDKNSCLTTFNEGIKKYPRYYNLYFETIPCRLGNDKQERLRKWEYIANLAAKNNKTTDDDALYSRVYWVVSSYFGVDNLKDDTLVNWPRMKSSMQQVLKKYPDQWNYTHFAEISCRSNDKDFTRYLFQYIPRYQPDNWDDQEIYKYCKSYSTQ